MPLTHSPSILPGWSCSCENTSEEIAQTLTSDRRGRACARARRACSLWHAPRCKCRSGCCCNSGSTTFSDEWQAPGIHAQSDSNPLGREAPVPQGRRSRPAAPRGVNCAGCKLTWQRALAETAVFTPARGVRILPHTSSPLAAQSRLRTPHTRCLASPLRVVTEVTFFCHVPRYQLSFLSVELAFLKVNPGRAFWWWLLRGQAYLLGLGLRSSYRFQRVCAHTGGAGPADAPAAPGSGAEPSRARTPAPHLCMDYVQGRDHRPPPAGLVSSWTGQAFTLSSPCPFLVFAVDEHVVVQNHQAWAAWWVGCWGGLLWGSGCLHLGFLACR